MDDGVWLEKSFGVWCFLFSLTQSHEFTGKLVDQNLLLLLFLLTDITCGRMLRGICAQQPMET